MVILYSIPIVLSSFLIAAHFIRNDLQLIAVACLLLPLLLLFRKSWIPKLTTAFLVLYSIEWVRTMFSFIEQYKVQERPFLKLVMILSSVIALTLLSSTVFKTQAMKKRYREDNDGYLKINR